MNPFYWTSVLIGSRRRLVCRCRYCRKNISRKLMAWKGLWTRWQHNLSRSKDRKRWSKHWSWLQWHLCKISVSSCPLPQKIIFFVKQVTNRLMDFTYVLFFYYYKRVLMKMVCHMKSDSVRMYPTRVLLSLVIVQEHILEFLECGLYLMNRGGQTFGVMTQFLP